MNLLYLSHRIPYPPDKGDKIRSYHQVATLAARHRLHVVCFVDAAEDERHVPALRERVASLSCFRRGRATTLAKAALGLVTGRSLSVAAFSSGAMRRAVRALLARTPIDAVVVYSSAMAQYVLDVADRPRIIDFVDVDSEKWRAYAERARGPMRLVYRIEADRLGRFDAAVAAAFDASIFVSRAEADLFARRASPRRTLVAPTGVDLDHFRPSDTPTPDRDRTIAFVGMMDYFPNADAVTHFAEDVLPLVRDRVPDARFLIVGRNPTSKVRALASLPGVVVTGAVPDVRPFVSSAGVSVVPFRVARGVQSKVLEAMAMGVPVVGTALAFQGIGAREEDGAVAAEGPRALADRVVRFLTDGAARRAAGAAARRYVERHHRMADHPEAIDDLLTDLVGARKANAR